MVLPELLCCAGLKPSSSVGPLRLSPVSGTGVSRSWAVRAGGLGPAMALYSFTMSAVTAGALLPMFERT